MYRTIIVFSFPQELV